ncbi:ABC transporter substrate-binding protein [Silvanigrella aquatica]|nr:ABC transporter substrate-binding protein [Silvanigrella aquatica]
MLRNAILLCIALFTINSAFTQTKINVLLHDSEGNPYDKNAPRGARIAIEVAVLGQLLTINNNNNIVPELLERTFYDFKEKEYVLILKKNIYFHNNRLAKAQDLEFSLLRLLYTKEKAYEKDALKNIYGLEEIEKQGLTKFKSGVVPGVKIVDDYTIRIKLIAPDPDFLYMLSDTSFSLVPIEEFKDNYVEWKTFPIGAGPYAIEAPGFDQGIVKLKKVSTSLGKAPDIVHFYTKNEPHIDYEVSTIKLPEEKQKIYKTITAELPTRIFSLTFTNVNPLGNSLDFRRFVQKALNKEKLNSKVLGYSPTFENYPYTFWGIHKLKNPYDPEGAKKLFQSLPKEIREKEWQISVYSGGKEIKGNNKLLIEEIQGQLSEYGFKTHYITYYKQFLPKEIAEKAPLDISFFQVDQYDSLYKFARLLNSGSDEFAKPLYDQKLEDLYNKALSSESKEEKSKTIDELSEYVHEQAYWVPLLERKSVIYYNPQTIEGLAQKEEQTNEFFAPRVVMRSKE